MGLLHWLDHWLASLERVLVVLLLTGLLGLGLLQVIERNLLASGIFWADELRQHLVLWLSFLGASLATPVDKRQGTCSFPKRRRAW